MSASVALLCALLVGAPTSEEEEPKSKSYDVGDLGLDELEAEKAADPAASSGFGVGVNTTLLPTIGEIPGGGSATTISPGLSLRLWTGQLMIEPIVGFGFRSGAPPTFRMTAGALAGFALAGGNLKPILGGGVLFALRTGSVGNQTVTSPALTVGPMFGVEYRPDSLPQLSLDAALFLPLQFEFDPFVFSLATSGGALVGFHYYFK